MITVTMVVLAVVGAVIAAVVGSMWYSLRTPMGRLQLRYLGFDTLTAEEKQQKIAAAKPMMWKVYLAQLSLSFLMALFIVFVMTMSVQNGLPVIMAAVFPVLAWLCFSVPTMGAGILWSNCERSIAWKKFLSDSVSQLVTILLIALMTSLFV